MGLPPKRSFSVGACSWVCTGYVQNCHTRCGGLSLLCHIFLIYVRALFHSVRDFVFPRMPAWRTTSHATLFLGKQNLFSKEKNHHEKINCHYSRCHRSAAFSLQLIFIRQCCGSKVDRRPQGRKDRRSDRHVPRRSNEADRRQHRRYISRIFRPALPHPKSRPALPSQSKRVPIS